MIPKLIKLTFKMSNDLKEIKEHNIIHCKKEQSEESLIDRYIKEGIKKDKKRLKL